MKILQKLLLLLALTVSLQAQQSMTLTPLAANTVSNILAAGAIIDNLTVINSTTNNATLDFFDTSNTATTYVQQAYSAFSSYATNFTVIWTNASGSLVTNTFSGIYTAPSAVALGTNTRPKVITLVIPASAVLNKDVRLQVVRGLAAVGNQDLTLTTTYRKPQ